MSNNPIDKIPPEMFLPLDQLETLTLSNNRLKHLPNFSKEIYRKFSSVNVSDNLLADFPFELENLSHLDLSSNQFDRFPSVLLRSLALKVLLFEDNRLKEIPPDLSQLHKLKESHFRANPLKDNRLKKLIDQDKIKAIFEYLEKQMKRTGPSGPSTTAKTTDKPRQPSTDEQKSTNLIRILHFDHQPDSKAKQITILSSTTTLRRHFLSAVFINSDLEATDT